MNLEKAGLLRQSGQRHYPTIRKSLKLIVDEVNEQVSLALAQVNEQVSQALDEVNEQVSPALVQS